MGTAVHSIVAPKPSGWPVRPARQPSTQAACNWKRTLYVRCFAIGLSQRACERMGTGSEPGNENPGKNAGREGPVPVLSHPRGMPTVSDHPPLLRQWLLLKTLSARRYGATVAEMAAELGVGEKTIRRDLKAFFEVGFPIEEQIGEHGRKSWRLKPSGDQPELSFAFDEALALYLGRRFLEPLAGTIFWQAAQSAFKKIRACLGKPAVDYLEKMAGNLHHTTVGISDYSQKAELIDELMRAIEDRMATHIVYHPLHATEPVTYEIHPYGLTYHQGTLYLVAFSRDRSELRHFKVDRIEQAEVSRFPFRMPDDFNLDGHFAKSFGIFQGDGDIVVRVRFLPAVARYVSEGKWHASQKLSPQKDGSLLAEFRLSTTEEIRHWIMSFGKQRWCWSRNNCAPRSPPRPKAW